MRRNVFEMGLPTRTKCDFVGKKNVLKPKTFQEAAKPLALRRALFCGFSRFVDQQMLELKTHQREAGSEKPIPRWLPFKIAMGNFVNNLPC